jgi:hypothetical protein
MHELQAEYAYMVNHADECQFDLGNWLPSFRKQGIRPLIPGELCFIVADTGHGKSAALQNICAVYADSVLFFEMELPGTLMFERFAARGNNIECVEVERRYKAGNPTNLAGIQHIYDCDATGLTEDTIAKVITEEAPKVMNGRPVMVCVDYIGLMSASGKSRYERMSCAAEGLKRVAKDTNTIIFAASQRSRGEEEESEVGLHDAKDSGSIENSCGMMIGMWKDEHDASTLWLRVNKNTKGGAGTLIKARFDGARMRIWEDEASELRKDLSGSPYGEEV